VPPHYRKDLLLKLQRFHQGTLSVDAYFKELKTLLTNIKMHESEESKMARLVRGRKRDIQDVVELYEYTFLEKWVHFAIKVLNFPRKTLLKILIMMAFTTHLRQINKNLLQPFPLILKRSPFTNQRIQNPHLQLLYHPQKPQVKNVLNV